MEYTKAFDFDLKQLDDSEEPGTFEGYVSTFRNIDRQRDIVMPAAFDRTIKETKGRVPVLMGHQMARIVGFGLSAEVDAKGLKVRGQFTLDSDEGRNAYATAKHAAKLKHPLGMSIGYGIPEGGAEYDEPRGIRKLHDIDLFEYSIACIPANERARFTAVKTDGMWTERDFEEYLREAGLSREAAKRFVLRGYGGLVDRRDAGGGNQGADPAFTAAMRELKDYISLIGA